MSIYRGERTRMGMWRTRRLYIGVLSLILTLVRAWYGPPRQSYAVRYPFRCQRLCLRMDDEVARAGIKQELTTKDEYLDTRFTKLSTSGHDLTPLTAEEKREWASVKKSSDIVENTGLGARGLYCCAVGGLPIYSSGSRLDKECNSTALVFSEPCDPEHVEVRKTTPGHTAEVYCRRSGTLVARAELGPGDCVLRHIVPLSLRSLHFHDLRRPFPIESRPESLWGTEDQFSFNIIQGSFR